MPVIETPLHMLAVVVIAAYLLGSVPFGVVMARLFGLGDLRRIGSGNIGATNVLRTGNRVAALLTLVFDAGKGAAAVVAARWALGPDAAQLAGLAAFAGHVYPVFLRFAGGKGVATYLGTLLALSFPVGLAACVTWLAVAAALRYSSLAALVAAATSPLWAFALGAESMVALALVLTLLIFWRHRENIARLRAGTESRIGKKG
jgi:acyl phosphate:glycerol-3-phosphate acyltransferase